MDTCTPLVPGAASSFYAEALSRLDRAGIPYLVGGSYAFASYSRIARDTKDFDIFLLPDDLPRALAVFKRSGCKTELPFPHWLGKVHSGTHFMDLIFSSGNGVARVDESWFEHAVDADVLGRRMRLCAAEEMIWSKAYVQERERFDGADVMHLIRALGPTLDWARLLVRFGDHWRLLLSVVVLFGFVYPDQRRQIPAWVLSELLLRLDGEGPEPEAHVCNGTLARAVPPRPRTIRLRGRARPAARNDDGRGNQDLDRRHRNAEVASTHVLRRCAADDRQDDRQVEHGSRSATGKRSKSVAAGIASAPSALLGSTTAFVNTSR